MSTKEDKFDVLIKINVEIKKGDALFAESDFNQKYPNMDYMQMVATQQAINQLAQILLDLGWTEAEAMGFSIEEIEIAERVAKGKGKGLGLAKKG